MVGLLAHEPVPHDLGQDRGGGHRRALGVAVDDRAHRTLEAVLRMAQEIDRSIDQDGLGGLGEPGQGAAGRHPERLGHTPLVALGRRRMPDGPVLAPCADRAEDLLAPRLAEHLGVPQPRRHGALLHAGAHDGDAHGQRAGPGTAADLVETGHRVVPLGAQAALLLEVR